MGECLITQLVAEAADCSNGDAQGIVEANHFYMSQAWGRGMTPEQAAELIMSKREGCQ